MAYCSRPTSLNSASVATAGGAPGLQACRYLRCRVLDQYGLHVLNLRDECEADPTDKKKIMVLGGGPNRIGQGIELDCCVHAAMAIAKTVTRPSW